MVLLVAINAPVKCCKQINSIYATIIIPHHHMRDSCGHLRVRLVICGHLQSFAVRRLASVRSGTQISVCPSSSLVSSTLHSIYQQQLAVLELDVGIHMLHPMRLFMHERLPDSQIRLYISLRSLVPGGPG